MGLPGVRFFTTSIWVQLVAFSTHSWLVNLPQRTPCQKVWVRRLKGNLMNTWRIITGKVTVQWLTTVVIVGTTPKDRLWDPFQMAELYGLYIGVIWGDPN